jgi:methylmalonyl-CoA decarboxylase
MSLALTDLQPPIGTPVRNDTAKRNRLSDAVMKEELRLLAGAHTSSPRMFERLQGMRRTVYDSRDYEQGKPAFKERRKPNFRGE